MTVKLAPVGRAPRYCSFCGKREDEVFKLIEAPGKVGICDECVELCSDIVARAVLNANPTTGG